MANSPVDSILPVFILSGERTGSTLLRYLLDTHAEIYAPDELYLGKLCSVLANAVEGTQVPGGEFTKSGATGFTSEVLATTRRLVEELLVSTARSRGKRVWCEKSPDNLRFLSVLKAVFPDARWVCLHRHCMDVVRSCLHACRYGFWPGLAPYVSRSPQNLIDAMAQGWRDKTRSLLKFEQEHPQSCHRVLYESLVTDPEGCLRSLCEFLGVSYDPSLVTNALRTEHAHRWGRGDESVRFSTRIFSRLGRGDELPWRERLAADRLAEVNALLQELGYPAMDPGEERYRFDGVVAAGDGDTRAVTDVGTFFEHELKQRLRTRAGLARELASSFRFVITGEAGGEWVLDLASAPAPEIRRGGTAAATLTLPDNVFLGLVNGELSAAGAFREGAIQVDGLRDPAVLLKLVHLLA